MIQVPTPTRLRIAYVTASLMLGGSERQMLILARHLPRDRFDIEFVLLGQPGPLADEARAAGARIHALRGPSRSGVWWPLWAMRVVAAVITFTRLVRRRHYDIVDAWLFGSYALAAVTQPLTRVPVLVIGRRSLSDFKATFTLPQRLADRLARRRADAIVANGYAVAEDVCRREGLAADQVRVIRNAVEVFPRPPAAELDQIRAAWGVADGSLVIGCVANYKRGKGIEVLIDAFADLLAEHPASHLVLVGEGPLRASFIAQIAAAGMQERVTLAGAIPDPRQLAFAFDIAVLASESEGLSNALLEAAAAGCPLLATDAGAAREIVVDGETGFLVPIGDRAAIAAALVKLAADPALRATLGAAARRRVQAEFGVERAVAAFAALYEQLASQSPRRGA